MGGKGKVLAGEGSQGGVGKQDREGFNDGMTGATLQVGEAAPGPLQRRSEWKVQPETVGQLVPPKLSQVPDFALWASGNEEAGRVP